MTVQTKKKLIKREFIYPLLALFTIILVLWQHFGMNKTLSIYPDFKVKPFMRNDAINGGISNGTFSDLNNQFLLYCQIRRSNPVFPFCALMIPFIEGRKGFNLEVYQSLDIWLSIESETKDTVIIYLNNKEEKLKNKRANSRTIIPKDSITHYSLPLDSFSVPSWWVFANMDEISNSDRRLDNVTDIQITTGDNTFERTETIKVERIEIKGKLLIKQQLFTAILILWVSVMLLDLVLILIGIRSRLASSKFREQELENINQLLSIERSKYESMAKTDPLTKAYNRAGIRGVLKHAVEQFEIDKVPCAIILLDIDNFKLINDQLGHNVGDEILINLVELIHNNTRTDDCLARWGGEEFIVICQNTSFESAIRLAEKYRDKIENTSLYQQVSVTCSFGVTKLDSKDIKACFKRADEALYRAKNQGRNQVAY